MDNMDAKTTVAIEFSMFILLYMSLRESFIVASMSASLRMRPSSLRTARMVSRTSSWILCIGDTTIGSGKAKRQRPALRLAEISYVRTGTISPHVYSPPSLLLQNVPDATRLLPVSYDSVWFSNLFLISRHLAVLNLGTIRRSRSSRQYLRL
jgi:hypothetical protein